MTEQQVVWDVDRQARRWVRALPELQPLSAILDITLEISKGETLDRAHEDALRVADLTGCRVSYTFNDVRHDIDKEQQQ